MRREEETIAMRLAVWLQKDHKDLIYRFDLSADLKLTIGQASKVKRLNRLPKYPDFFLAETYPPYGGLFIELKKDRGEVFRKNGTYKKSNHVHGQRIVLDILQKKGYYAVFAFGLEDAKQIIEDYTRGITDERHQKNYPER